MKLSSHITGSGAYLPERIVHNDDLAKRLDTSHEWIVERTGIHQRHVAASDQQTSDLAAEAARAALADAGISIDDIDGLIVATTTPDLIFPSTASIVQSKLGGSGFPAWDIQAVCSGFVYALAQADGMIKGGMFRRLLVIGAETMTRIVDWNDRSTCVLFGDGAGAVVLEADDAAAGAHGGIVGSILHCDGAYRDLLKASRAEAGRLDVSAEDLRIDSAGIAAIEMRGNEVFRIAVTKLGEVVGEILQQYELRDSDLDWLVPHQANIRILKATARKLKMGMDRLALTVGQHANTSSASVPLALNDLYRQGKLQKGQLVLLEAFAGGFAWGANLLRWSKD